MRLENIAATGIENRNIISIATNYPSDNGVGGGEVVAQTPKLHWEAPTVLRNAKSIVWNLKENTPEQNEALGIRNIQGLFLEKFPGFFEQFSMTDNGVVVENRKENAAQYIKEKFNTAKEFIGCFGYSPLSGSCKGWSEGSWITILEKSFISWGIPLDYMRVDKITEKYVKNGQSWITLPSFEKQNGISRRTAAKNLKDISRILGRDKSDKEETLYNEEELLKKLDFLIAAPLAHNTGENYRVEGKKITFVTIPQLIKKFEQHNFSYKGLLTLLKDFPVQKGRTERGVVALYSESDVLPMINDFIALPCVGENGEYINENGVSYVPYEFLRQMFGAQQWSSIPELEGVESILGRKTGKKIRLINKLEALEIFNKRKALQRKAPNSWTDEVIEDAVSKVFATHGFISYTLLKNMGLSDLASAIQHSGGIKVRKEKMQLKAKEEKQVISPDEATDALLKYIQEDETSQP